MPPLDKAPPTIHPALTRHSGHINLSGGLPGTAFGPGANARENVRPTLGYTTPMLILDHPQCLVVKADQGPPCSSLSRYCTFEIAA